MLFGFQLETIYLITLLVIGSCTFLYILFGDVADGALEGIPFLDPATILAFISFTSATGYILEKFTSLTSWIVLIIALLIGSFAALLVYYLLLVPLRSAEVSLVYTEESLEGKLAKVITPIPLNGFGEIIIDTINGVIAKRAASFKGEEIPYDQTVLIIEVRDGTAFVTVYEE